MSHLQILGARMVTCSNFHTQDPNWSYLRINLTVMLCFLLGAYLYIFMAEGVRNLQACSICLALLYTFSCPGNLGLREFFMPGNLYFLFS